MKPKQRYNLALPSDLAEQLEAVAQELHISVTELLRLFIKLGLIAHQVSTTPGAELIYREGTQERQIILL